MQGILVQGSTQTTKVMMLAYTIDLEVLTIEPETRLGIELKIAEARSGLVGIHHLTPTLHFCTYLIYIGGLTRPPFHL